MRKLIIIVWICLTAFIDLRAQNLDSIAYYDVVKKDFLSTRQMLGKHGLVLFFIGSHCPYVDLYKERMLGYRQEYLSKGFHFAIVNSNSTVGDKVESIEQMRKEALAMGYQYISDQSQTIMNAYQIQKNPEVAVVRNTELGYEIAYKGAIDDSPRSATGVKVDYLRKVLDNLLVGKPSPVKDQRAVGCVIK